MTKKILIAASNYWTSPFQVGSHHFARIFADNEWEVFFVSDPISPFHFLNRKKEQVLERYRIHKGLVESGYNNIKIYVPMALITPYNRPLFNTRMVANNWYRMTFPNIVKFARKNGFGEVDLVWFDSILQSFWIEEIKYKKSILRVCDKFDEFKKISKSIQYLEKGLREKVDTIIYTAHTLESYLKGYENKIFYVPNGVDFEHFYRSDKKIPEDLKKIPRPIAIYVGAIDEWFGIDFLLNVAKKCRDISFVIIGRPNIDIAILKGIPNIFLLGRKDYLEVPGYIHNSDVGIIIFDTRHPLVQFVNPIKLYEYMACGKPVIATKWKELELLKSPAYLAENIDDFINGLRGAIGNKEIGNELIKYAKSHSWYESFKKINMI